VVFRPDNLGDWDCRLDDLVTSRWFGYSLMAALPGAIFWITNLRLPRSPEEGVAGLIPALIVPRRFSDTWEPHDPGTSWLLSPSYRFLLSLSTTSQAVI